jgi:hypothetical protein
MELVGLEHISPHRRDERIEELACQTYPTGEGGAIEIDPHLADKAGSIGKAVRDRITSILEHGQVAPDLRVPARSFVRVPRGWTISRHFGQESFWAYIPDHFEVTRHALEHLGNVLTQEPHLGGALGRRVWQTTLNESAITFVRLSAGLCGATAASRIAPASWVGHQFDPMPPAFGNSRLPNSGRTNDHT